MYYKSSGVYSFGKQKKSTEQTFINKNNIVGPGTYNTPEEDISRPKSAAFTFSKSSKNPKNNNKNPGPGEYSNENNIFGKNFPKYSISKSTRITEFNKKIKKDKLLGPGEYKIEKAYKKIIKSSPAYRMSKTPKKINYNNHVPGPGEYKTKEYFGKTFIKRTSDIFGSKKESIFEKCIQKEKNNPGPGTYEIDEKKYLKSSKSCIFGKSDKFEKIKNDTPGVGKYNIYKENNIGEGPIYQFGKSKKKDIFMEEKDINIGPGAYENKREFDNNNINGNNYNKGTFSKSEKYKKIKNNTPGVGQYNITNEYKIKSNKNSMGTSEKKSIFYKKESNLGPGSYNTIESSLNSSIGFKFSKDEKLKNIKSNTPGVGKYNIDKDSLNIKKTEPKFSIGKQKKESIFNNKNNENLGPGSYNEPQINITGYKFSKQPKFKKIRNDTPGPGAYHTPCSIAHNPTYKGGKFNEEYKYI